MFKWTIMMPSLEHQGVSNHQQVERILWRPVISPQSGTVMRKGFTCYEVTKFLVKSNMFDWEPNCQNRKVWPHTIAWTRRVVACWNILSALTHWGRVTHICVGTNTNIGSDNGLSPGGRQAIIWTNAGILLIGPLATNFSEILIEILKF